MKNGYAKDQQQLDCAQGHGFAGLENASQVGGNGRQCRIIVLRIGGHLRLGILRQRRTNVGGEFLG
jgi:hypothetical protein